MVNHLTATLLFVTEVVPSAAESNYAFVISKTLIY